MLSRFGSLAASGYQQRWSMALHPHLAVGLLFSGEEAGAVHPAGQTGGWLGCRRQRAARCPQVQRIVRTPGSALAESADASLCSIGSGSSG